MRLLWSQTPSKGGRIRITIVTAAAIAIVFLFYYLHFRTSLDRIHVRNLRLLANMSTQIEDAIGGYVSVVKSLYENPCPQYTQVGRFLNEQTSLYTLPPHPPEECNSKTGRCFFIEHDLEGVSWLHLHMRQPVTADAAAAGAWKPACAVANRKLEPVGAGVNLNSEFEYFMPTDEFGGTFDLVLIADMKGEIVYQTPHTQLRVANLQSLVHGETGAGSQATAGETNRRRWPTRSRISVRPVPSPR